MVHDADPIQFRPRIGVFINQKFLDNSKLALFAGKLNQANEKAKCSIFYFSPESIDWKEKTMAGYVFRDKGRGWLQCRWPFPDIIYDRGTGFAAGEREAVKALRARLNRFPEVHFINSCKLKKLQVHQKLSKNEAVKKYLPKARFSRGIDDIRAMLDNYGYLFLKSSGGSGGKGVFAVETCNGGFYFRYYSKGLHRKRYVSNLGSLPSELKRIGLKPDRVIIQQGIRFVKIYNRFLDLRILMVKDKDGIWNAVYNQARVAPKGAVITNTSLGGDVMKYRDIYPVLKNRYPDIPSERQIQAISIVISRYIEKEFGSFGEIGIDIGVDVTGKAWLLEANSKPSKLPEQGIEDTRGISPQFLMILEYARFLYFRKRPT